MINNVYLLWVRQKKETKNKSSIFTSTTSRLVSQNQFPIRNSLQNNFQDLFFCKQKTKTRSWTNSGSTWRNDHMTLRCRARQHGNCRNTNKQRTSAGQRSAGRRGTSRQQCLSHSELYSRTLVMEKSTVEVWRAVRCPCFHFFQQNAEENLSTNRRLYAQTMMKHRIIIVAVQTSRPIPDMTAAQLWMIWDVGKSKKMLKSGEKSINVLLFLSCNRY